ncbi:hypothetical protein INT45_014170 [Circinella minor]|uniref:Uncharacterized protein n=1 Tax=Circinella minor TaxID=1195481 RepID=A0A8H7RZA3_9FUNG|nr:hypothetical protein INT45_014170 [Circinella minor]
MANNSKKGEGTRQLTTYTKEFEPVDSESKWELSDGTIVEDLLYAYGVIYEFEHSIHSYCIHASDETLKKKFSKEQIRDIKTAGNYNFLSLPISIQSMLNGCDAIKKAVVDAVYKEITKNGFYDPYQQFDEDWFKKKTILEILSYYRWDVLKSVEKWSEMDLVVRLWSLFDKAFDNLHMETKRDHTSVSMNISQNEDRVVSGENSIPTKANSFRPDLIYSKDGLEYGTAECGKSEDATAKKKIIETQLHISKIMKAMFHRLLEKCKNNKTLARKIQVVAFSQLGRFTDIYESVPPPNSNSMDGEDSSGVAKTNDGYTSTVGVALNEFEVGSIPSIDAVWCTSSLEISIKIKGQRQR